METHTHNTNTINFKHISTHPTKWDPSSVHINMNVRLDGCIVPSTSSSTHNDHGARISYSHVVVLDNFIDDCTTKQLLDYLTSPRSTNTHPNLEIDESKSTTTNQWNLPCHIWERKTADMDGEAPTWGVKSNILDDIASGKLPAVVEIQSRLKLLYKEYDIAHFPSDDIQMGGVGRKEEYDTVNNEIDDISDIEDINNIDNQRMKKHKYDDAPRTELHQEKEEEKEEEPPHQDPGTIAPPAGNCSAFLVNAAVNSDAFKYHIDADPATFAWGTRWHDSFGQYFNGEPGKPLLVSLIVYLLDEEWERDWAADTLFLDASTDTGVFVRPRAGRAVLMDQDVVHRISAPSILAGGGRARLSLVWKLVFLPKKKGQECCISKSEWGLCSNIGSAARVENVKRQLMKEMSNK